jgi:uncharacterized OB-fold protein
MSIYIDGKLNGVKCNDCGHIRFPFMNYCNKCQSENVSSYLIGPKGKLMSYTISYTRPMMGKFKAPYAYGVSRFSVNDGKQVDVLGIIKPGTPFEKIKINDETELIEDKIFVIFKMVGVEEN